MDRKAAPPIVFLPNYGSKNALHKIMSRAFSFMERWQNIDGSSREFHQGSMQPELREAIANCGIRPDSLNLGLERNLVKQLLAQVRAVANPEKFAYRLNLSQPITRNVWGRRCDIEGIDSGLPFYEEPEIRKLTRTCIWFAKGGTQEQLEQIIIREEEHAYQDAA